MIWFVLFCWWSVRRCIFVRHIKKTCATCAARCAFTSIFVWFQTIKSRDRRCWRAFCQIWHLNLKWFILCVFGFFSTWNLHILMYAFFIKWQQFPPFRGYILRRWQKWITCIFFWNGYVFFAFLIIWRCSPHKQIYKYFDV